MSDFLLDRRRGIVNGPLLFGLTAWLVVQNVVLLALGHAHAAPAPLVVTRVLAAVAVKLATLYPVTALLVLVTVALVIYFGFDLLRGREIG